MNIAELYNALLLDNEDGQKAKQLLLQTHWFTINSVFDPRSGKALPQTLTGFCQKIVFPDEKKQSLHLHDRLWKITEHARDAIEQLIYTLNESPKREHALLPIRSVKELDSSSFIKLSQRPGRNIREKLAGKPYLQAIRRYQSIDLPENRLLKAFAIRLHELLTIRKECLGEEDVPLLSKLENWLKSDRIRNISRWDNLLPNNTLLSHRNYRRVWDAWVWLQSLDEDIDKDFSDLSRRQKVMDFWKKIAQFRFSADTIMSELPIEFDYDKFIITPWNGQTIYMAHGPKKRYKLSQNIELPNVLPVKKQTKSTMIIDPVCVDLSSTTAIYSTGENFSKTLQQFVWQNWTKNKEKFSYLSPNAEAIILGENIETIIPKSIFNLDTINKTSFEQAALSFAKEWRNVFQNDTLIWVVPDILNDFDLDIIRRNINSVFPDARPLPKSIAAIYEFVDFSKIKGDGYPVIVVDHVGGKLTATKLTSKFDPKLKKIIPETYGYAWERHPSKCIEIERDETNDFYVVNANGEWTFPTASDTYKIINDEQKESLGIKKEYVINLTNTPVRGGYKLFSLQERAKDIPLWYDHLPNLAMCVQINGIMSNFQLVKDKTILPMRGHKIPIEIPQKFTLSGGANDYKFPLVQGNKDTKLKYMAHLHSPMFPLKENSVFSLKMMYEYGANIPYQLTFVSDNEINGQPLKIIVSWLPYSDTNEFINAYNYPEFPSSPSLENILNDTHKKSLDCFKRNWWKKFFTLYNKQTDFQKNAGVLIKKIDCINPIPNKQFAFGQLSDTYEKIYCNENAFRDNNEFLRWCNGTSMFAIVIEKEKGLAALRVSSDIEELKKEQIRKLQKDLTSFRRSLHYSLYKILGNIQDWDKEGHLSRNFAQDISDTIQYVLEQQKDSSLPKPVAKEFYLLLAFAHKYAPVEFGEYIVTIFNSLQWKEYITEIGYSIGDCSKSWQKNIWSILLSHWAKIGIIEAGYVRVMNIALFRYPKLMNDFTFEQANSYIDKIISRLERDIDRLNIHKLVEYSNAPRSNNVKNKKEYFLYEKASKKITALLELSLLILRLRSSEDEKIKNLLDPTSSRILKFLNLLNKLDNINFNNLSRVKISVAKPQTAQHISDLLFALKYYMSGSNEDAGIQILEITNEIDE